MTKQCYFSNFEKCLSIFGHRLECAKNSVVPPVPLLSEILGARAPASSMAPAPMDITVLPALHTLCFIRKRNEPHLPLPSQPQHKCREQGETLGRGIDNWFALHSFSYRGPVPVPFVIDVSTTNKRLTFVDAEGAMAPSRNAAARNSVAR